MAKVGEEKGVAEEGGFEAWGQEEGGEEEVSVLGLSMPRGFSVAGIWLR
jgi:hypothetical protein